MMPTFIFIFTIIVSFFTLRACSGSASVRYVNGLNYIFYRQIILGALLGSYAISLNLEYDRWYSLDWSQSVRFWGFLSVCYSIIAMLLCYLVLKKIFIGEAAPSRKNISDEMLVPFQLILFLMTIAGLLYIYKYSTTWPMLDAINGNSVGALEGRIAFRNDFKGSEIIRNIFCFSSASAYLYLSFSRFLINRSGRTHFMMSVILAVLVYTYNSQKGAILNVLIGTVIIYCIIRGKINLKWFFITAVAGVIFIILLFSVVKGIPFSYLIGPGSKLILGRLVFGNIEGFFSSLQLYPDVIKNESYLVGLPSFLQHAFWGEIQEPSKLTLMKYFDHQGVSDGTSGYITSYFLAEAWANYGVLGIIISPLIIAFNLILAELILHRMGISITSVTLYAMLYIQFQLHGEFVGFLYFKYFIFSLIFTTPFLILYFALKKQR